MRKTACKAGCLRKTVRALLLAFLAGILLVSSLPAALLQKLSLPELVGHADLVVAAPCENCETAWLGKKIYTIATVRVTRAAKGQAAPGQTLRVHVPGGRVTQPLPVEMHVEGNPHPACGHPLPSDGRGAGGEGDSSFLQRYGHQKQFHRILGLSQGKLPVTTDLVKGVEQFNRPPRFPHSNIRSVPSHTPTSVSS